ncbi:MAG: hypothetical protein JO266_05050 [Acidobacteria bacterium]|nr:hypothetical protein [Acidobacteriota bacterium]
MNGPLSSASIKVIGHNSVGDSVRQAGVLAPSALEEGIGLAPLTHASSGHTLS